MRISASIVLGICLLAAHEKSFVSSQDNVTTVADVSALGDEVFFAMPNTTDSPTEEVSLISAESEAPIETSAPTDGIIMADPLGEDTIAPSLRGSEVGTEDETIVPSMDDSIAETMVVVAEIQPEGSNSTNLDEVQQEIVVGDVAVETDATEMPMGTPAPTTEEEDGVVETVAPMDGTETPVVDAVPSSVPVETSAPTETPEDDTSSEVAVTDTVESGEPATECAVQVFNTEPVCAQLLKFTTAVCDCYNFCSGKLIACLKYGERNSFSCTGETVAGCTADQRAVSGAPQRIMAGSFTAVVAASAATLFV